MYGILQNHWNSFDMVSSSGIHNVLQSNLDEWTNINAVGCVVRGNHWMVIGCLMNEIALMCGCSLFAPLCEEGTNISVNFCLQMTSAWMQWLLKPLAVWRVCMSIIWVITVLATTLKIIIKFWKWQTWCLNQLVVGWVLATNGLMSDWNVRLCTSIIPYYLQQQKLRIVRKAHSNELHG